MSYADLSARVFFNIGSYPHCNGSAHLIKTVQFIFSTKFLCIMKIHSNLKILNSEVTLLFLRYKRFRIKTFKLCKLTLYLKHFSSLHTAKPYNCYLPSIQSRVVTSVTLQFSGPQQFSPPLLSATSSRLLGTPCCAP